MPNEVFFRVLTVKLYYIYRKLYHKLEFQVNSEQTIVEMPWFYTVYNFMNRDVFDRPERFETIFIENYTAMMGWVFNRAMRVFSNMWSIPSTNWEMNRKIILKIRICMLKQLLWQFMKEKQFKKIHDRVITGYKSFTLSQL